MIVQLASSHPHAKAPSAIGNDAQWVRAGQSVSVGGIRIEGGLVYVGERLSTQDGQRDERFLVDASLHVAGDEPDFEGKTIGFWPDYAQMAPRTRLAFLRWIAEGRDHPDVHPGYVLLYLYGLERRLILDRALDEAREILLEVQSIAARYAHHGSIRNALRGMVEAANAMLTGALPAPFSLGEREVERNSPTVIHAIGKCVAGGLPIDPDLVFAWVMSDPTRSFPVPGSQPMEELREAFRRHVEYSKPNGIFFDAAGAPPLGYTYRSQGGSFVVELDAFLESVPDITRNVAARMEAQVLVRDALERHRRNGRWRATASPRPAVASAVPSAPAVQALPHGKHVLQEWAREQIDLEGSISIRAALKRWRGQSPKMLARSEIERLADILAQIGLGIVPDPRFDLEPPRITEDALLFRLAEQAESLEPAGENYQTALLRAMTAMIVAKSDDDVARVEVEFVDQLIERSQGLTDSERLRLVAERRWMHMRPLPLSPVLDAIGRLTDRQKHEMASVVVDAAIADGQVPDAERGVVKAVLSRLGISASETARRLAAHHTALPAREATAQPDREGILIEDFYGSESVADIADVIAVAEAVQAEEQDVRSIPLQSNGIPGLDGHDDRAFGPVGLEADIWSLDALDEKHQKFLAALLQQVEWNRMALEQIARTQRLMPDGALETLNDWSHDACGELIFEVNDDIIHLNMSIAGLLRGIAC